MKRIAWMFIVLVLTNHGAVWAQTCGNNVVETGEQCDPPGSTCPLGGGAVGFCNALCACATATPTHAPSTPTPTPSPTHVPPTLTRTSTRIPTRTATPTATRTPPVSLSITDPQQPEGVVARFGVTLSRASTVPVTVNYSTVDGTAFEGSDYRPTSGTLTFAPGIKIQLISVTVIDDTLVEPNETFFVILTNPVNAIIAKAKGTDTIIDNDGPVGSSALVPPESSVTAGVRSSLALTWTTPVSWRDLDTVDLRLEDGDQVVLWVRFDQAQNTFSLCNTNDECGSGVPPETNAELRATSATLFLQESSVQGSGPTGPSVDLTYAFSVDPTLAGRQLLIEAAATDDSGNSQDFQEVGTLTVNAATTQGNEGNGGCSLEPPHTPRRGIVWLSLPFAAVLWRWGRVSRRRGRAFQSARTSWPKSGTRAPFPVTFIEP